VTVTMPDPKDPTKTIPVPGCDPATVATDGTWSCTPTSPLPDGQVTLTPVITDSDGNVVPGTPDTINVDTTPATITGPADGTTVATGEPKITGKGAKPGSSVTVDGSDGKPIPGCDPAKVADDGTWSCTPTSPLPEGQNTLTPVITDSDGNVVPGTPSTVNVDTTPATITGPANGTTVDTGTPDITGTVTQPGATVTVIGPDGKTPVPGCENIVPDATTGAWSCTPTSPLPDGQDTLTPVVTDSDGNVVPGTPSTVTVDTTPATITNPANGSTIATATPPISGTDKVPGSTVTVTDDKGNPIDGCVNIAPDASGNWTCQPTNPLISGPTGTVTLIPVVTDKNKDVEQGTPVTVTVDTVPPQITGPAAGAHVNTDQPKITGTGALPGSTVTVTMPDPKDPSKTVDVCSTVVTSTDGTWSCTPTQPLPQGDVTLTPTQVDSQGNQGPAGDPITFNVDSIPPAAPIVNPTDGKTITGTSEPGDTITIHDANGKPIPGCTNVVADSTGAFSCTPTTPLAPGSLIRVTATDAAGNVSPETDVTVLIPKIGTGGTLVSSSSALAVGGVALLAVAIGCLVAVIVRRRKSEEEQ